MSNKKMPTFPSASIILQSDMGHTDQQVHRTAEELGKAGWRAEILIVDSAPQSVETNATPSSERITYRPIPKRFNRFSEALKAAKHPLIAIVEPHEIVDKDHWNLLVKKSEQFPVQSVYRRHANLHPSRLSRIKKAILWIYFSIVRILLGTGKTQFHSGTTLLNRDGLESIWDELTNLEGRTNCHLSISRLISIARLHRVPVAETKMEFEFLETKGSRASTKAMRNAIGSSTKFWWNEIMFPRTQNDLPVKRFKSIEKTAAIGILLLIAVFILFRSLNFPLFEPDEARNAQLALNVIQSGQWMALTLADESYWDKPPFQIWAIATSYKLFGVSQFSTRLPVAIASLITLLLTVLIGKRLIGFRAAWLGGFLLLLTTGFVCSGRYVTMDASLTAAVTAMLLVGLLAITRGFKRTYALAAGVACGLGFLIKGPVIVVLCIPPLIAAYWLSRVESHNRLTNNQENQKSSDSLAKRSESFRQLLWFAIPAFLISAPWYIATVIIHPDFLSYFFWKHHVVRFSSAFNHREPFWYYFVGIFIFMFPASYLIPSLAKFLTSRKPENRLLRTREHGFLFLSAVWIIGFFSISESKLPTYILPAFPAICLLMGTLLERKIFDTKLPMVDIPTGIATTVQKKTWLAKVGRRAPYELLFWFVVTAIAVLVIFETQTASIGFLIATTLVLLGLVVAAQFNRHRPKLVWTCCGVMALFLISLTAHQLIPAISQSRSIHLAAKNLQMTNQFENAPVVFFGRESYGAELNLEPDRINVFEESDVPSVVEFLNDNPNAIIVSSDDPMEVLRRDLPWTILLEECEEGRHLYISHPNPSVVPSDAVLPVVAQQGKKDLR